VHQVGFPLQNYTEMHGQQNIKHKHIPSCLYECDNMRQRQALRTWWHRPEGAWLEGSCDQKDKVYSSVIPTNHWIC